MSKQRFVWLLVGAVLVLAVAYYSSARREQSIETSGGLLFPTLAAELNAVTEMQVHKGGTAPVVTLHKSGTQWVVVERNDYPADVTKLRKVLMALANAKIVEEKTSDPSRYAVIGVEDPTQAGSSGAEVRVLAPSGAQAVIVGKPAGEGTFVRRAGEKRSFSVEPALALETEPRDWIDSRLLDVQSTTLQTIQVKPATGAAYELRRMPGATAGKGGAAMPSGTPVAPSSPPTAPPPASAASAEATFALDGVPAGRQALDAAALAPSATLLTNLTAEDVAAATDIDFSNSSQVLLTLTDGKSLTLSGAVISDKHWIRVTATRDPALQAKADGRAFEIASYRYDAIFKPLDQLLVPKAQPAAKSPPGAPKRPAPAPAP